MLTLLNILCIVLLLLIVAQDFRYRAIYWWLCPLLAALFAVKGLLFTTDKDFLLVGWLVNTTIASLQLLLVWLYTLVRRKKANLAFSKSFGLGDILCLYAFCFLPPPYLFVILCCISYAVALISAWAFPGKLKTIPLAGWISIGGISYIAYELVTGKDLWEYIPLY